MLAVQGDELPYSVMGRRAFSARPMDAVSCLLTMTAFKYLEAESPRRLVWLTSDDMILYYPMV